MLQYRFENAYERLFVCRVQKRSMNDGIGRRIPISRLARAWLLVLVDEFLLVIRADVVDIRGAPDMPLDVLGVLPLCTHSKESIDIKEIRNT